MSAFRRSREGPARAHQRGAGAGGRRRRRGGGPEHPRPRSTATTSACSSAATARRSTPSSTWPSRPRRATTRRPRACAWSSTPPGYRERREQALQRQADEAAENAVDSGRPVALDAMSATERKVVHEYLKDREDVETYSEGTEPDRHLVVAPLD